MSRLISLSLLMVLAVVLVFSGGQAQQAGPLAQFKENVRQMHIIARYSTSVGGTPIQANVIQTVTAVAVRATASETLWLTEKEHLDPEYFYQQRNVPRGTPISFLIFVDTVDLVRVIQGGQGEPFEVARMTDHYAVLRELRPRSIPELPTAVDLRPDTPAIIALPRGGGITSVPTFVETETTIVEAQGGSPLFFIAFPERDGEQTHGAPVFVQRDGAWRLAGIRVAHGRSPRPDWSAVAWLPSLEALLKVESRVLDPSEYRVSTSFLGEIVLELHNVREPQNARNVQVIVEARINFFPRTFSETMDIVNGRGTKTITLGRVGEQVEVQRVTIRLP